MRQVCLLWCALCGIVSDSAPQISRVAVEPNEIEVTISPHEKRLSLHALWPFEADAAWQQSQPVWQGIATGGTVRLPRFSGSRDRGFARFVLVDPGRERVCNTRYATEIPRRREVPPALSPTGIKGVQSIVDVDDALALGVKQAAHNVLISQVVDWENPRPRETWNVDGVAVGVNAGGLAALDQTVGRLSNAGVTVTLILLNAVPTAPVPGNPLIHPATDLAAAPNHLGAFNLSDVRGLAHYRAAIEILASRYSQPGTPQGRITGVIVGNELQAHWSWYNLGAMPAEQVVVEYARALRIADLAAKPFDPTMRIYASMDHHWTWKPDPDPLKSVSGRELMDGLNAEVRREGNFDWQVAFHPYPQDLFNPRTWQDDQPTLAFSTPKITFKNLEVLPAYLAQEEFLTPSGAARRVILSEQGFHSPDGEEGELLQAAAYCYAFRRVTQLPTIDAFIYHRHADHAQEGGLHLGIWTTREGTVFEPGRKKKLWDVFEHADQADWQEHFEFAKPILGITDWAELAPAADVVRD
jgi:hypothetical protein